MKNSTNQSQSWIVQIVLFAVKFSDNWFLEKIIGEQFRNFEKEKKTGIVQN